MDGFGTGYSASDRFQQRHRWLGFPLAVLQKYADDQGGYHAATISYYGFFAIFPLLLVLTTLASTLPCKRAVPELSPNHGELAQPRRGRGDPLAVSIACPIWDSSLAFL